MLQCNLNYAKICCKAFKASTLTVVNWLKKEKNMMIKSMAISHHLRIFYHPGFLRTTATRVVLPKKIKICKKKNFIIFFLWMLQLRSLHCNSHITSHQYLSCIMAQHYFYSPSLSHSLISLLFFLLKISAAKNDFFISSRISS